MSKPSARPRTFSALRSAVIGLVVGVATMLIAAPSYAATEAPVVTADASQGWEVNLLAAWVVAGVAMAVIVFALAQRSIARGRLRGPAAEAVAELS